ncbi:uncharacterized protein LOC131882965 isoform X2 [Tigriopus californicus]|uniref:uncharacterized protein LOC131882965 isoform X2 n=1 Tax=Tigriopus californicus TaxID=6832 RepID=UPI0027D9DB74|nr:uncharacterized protein LOC131882965 isoform X2 [Tigriopus californicus]
MDVGATLRIGCSMGQSAWLFHTIQALEEIPKETKIGWKNLPRILPQVTDRRMDGWIDGWKDGGWAEKLVEVPHVRALGNCPICPRRKVTGLMLHCPFSRYFYTMVKMPYQVLTERIEHRLAFPACKMDHIQEVQDKWESIDDEIWAKIIVLERNRRVAKAYARAPVLTVNGSDDGFDGFRIGVSGFDNPMRDATTLDIIARIGQGFKLKMDDVGNILIKRISKGGVRVKNTNEESAVSNDILKLPAGLLESDKPFKVFDMKKFQQNMNRELKRPYPDRRKLEAQCISVISFGHSNEAEILHTPIWILIINIVAIEMLRSKLPPAPRMRPRSMEPRSLMTISTNHAATRPFGSGSSDEDPYSVAGSGSSGSSGGNGNRSRSRDKPPKLPPRDTAIYGPSLWAKPGETMKNAKNLDKRGDDPYYCGLRARIPNFVKSKTGGGTKSKSSKKSSTDKNRSHSEGPLSLPPQIPSHPFWWHSRLYNDSVGPMSLASNDHQTSTTGSTSISNGTNFKRNPTNFVPYITANGSEDYEEAEDLSY